ncbi:MAG TPA: aspartate/glutamate racemase family protein [Bacteroidota bacterium]
MKTLGLIGGTSWLSTAEYYRIINQQINQRLGGRNSAKMILHCINFQDFTPLVDSQNWHKMGEWFSDIARRLQHAGADCIIICANTPHIVADTIRQNVSIPLIHIAEVTAKEILKQKISSIGLLGTKITMEQSFFKYSLSRSGISTLIPGQNERDFLHSSILDELGAGIFKEETRTKYLSIIGELRRNGAEGIILGCTEIPLLIKPIDLTVPTFDTTMLHATAAVEFALAD